MNFLFANCYSYLDVLCLFVGRITIVWRARSNFCNFLATRACTCTGCVWRVRALRCSVVSLLARKKKGFRIRKGLVTAIKYAKKALYLRDYREERPARGVRRRGGAMRWLVKNMYRKISALYILNLRVVFGVGEVTASVHSSRPLTRRNKETR